MTSRDKSPLIFKNILFIIIYENTHYIKINTLFLLNLYFNPKYLQLILRNLKFNELPKYNAIIRDIIESNEMLFEC